MLIKPITIRLIAYGQKANVGNLRIRASALLKEEFDNVDESCFQELSAKDVHAEILAKRLDSEVELKKPTPAQAGIAITLPEVNERATTVWLYELPIAKTCVVFATWDSPREGMALQMLVADGARTSMNKPLGG